MQSTDIKIESKSIFTGKTFIETNVNTSDNFLVRTFKKVSREFEEAYYLNAAISIMLQSVLGGIATMLILANSANSPYYLAQLITSVMVCSLYNALILGQIKPKLVFKGLIVSVITSLVLIAINM